MRKIDASINSGMSAQRKPLCHGHGNYLMYLPVFLASVAVLIPELCLAQGGRYIEDPTLQDHVYKLIQSSFGTLLMVFSGLGGLATLYLRREGEAGDQIPFLGIALLLFALFLFTMRILIKSGVMGSDYVDFG